MIRKISVLMVYVAVLSILSGCGTSRPKAESWVLPKKENANSAMLIGFFDYPNNKKENPANNKLYLLEVNFMTKDKNVYFGNGEANIALDNNYFVVPNLKPGKYYLVSFRAGKLFNQLPLYDEKFAIDVKPGQIKFFGSYDFLEYDRSFMWAHSYSFNIRKTERPSELEILQWLNRAGAGTGWDPAIKKRIRELSGQP
jgi:hypothetical protein